MVAELVAGLFFFFFLACFFCLFSSGCQQALQGKGAVDKVVTLQPLCPLPAKILQKVPFNIIK